MEHDERACRALLQRWHREGDRAARDEVAERLLPLAHGLARRYAGKGEPLDDLEQVACVGLLKAIDRFDCAREVRFATFAVPDDRGGDQAPLPRSRVDAARPARGPGAHGAAQPDPGGPHAPARTPAAGRGARGRRRRDAGAGRRGAARRGGLPRACRSTRPRARTARRPPRALGGDDGGFERTEQRLLLRGGFEALAPREREILRLRFFEGLTQREIADRVGISQMHVSRLIRRSLDQLRIAMDVAGRDVPAGGDPVAAAGPAACRRWPPPLDG